MIEEDGQAVMFFSEGPAERDYRLPEAVTKADVMAFDGKSSPTEVEWKTIEEDGFTGRKSIEKLTGRFDALFELRLWELSWQFVEILRATFGSRRDRLTGTSRKVSPRTECACRALENGHRSDRHVERQATERGGCDDYRCGN